MIGEFYEKFRHNNEADFAPLFISAEHGDGFTDLYRVVKDHIPKDKFVEYEYRKEKRL